MGFYSPSQLVQDAKRHVVEGRPSDVTHSDVDNTLEDLAHAPAVRRGFRLVHGLRTASAARIVVCRAERGVGDGQSGFSVGRTS